MTTALLIDAEKREIRPIKCDGYNDMLPYLPGGITVAWVFHDTGGDVLYVDEEGLLRPAKMAFRLRGRPDNQPMMSNGILTGRDHSYISQGDLVETTLDVSMTPEQLAPFIEWLTVEEALAWFRAQGGEPAITVQSDSGTEVIATWDQFRRNLEPK